MKTSYFDRIVKLNNPETMRYFIEEFYDDIEILKIIPPEIGKKGLGQMIVKIPSHKFRDFKKQSLHLKRGLSTKYERRRAAAG